LKEAVMQRPIGIALLVIGIILLILGINASQSVSSQVSETFRGTPSDRAIWLYVASALTGLPGLFLTFFSRSHP
jgi:uncharacterized membrane protein YidH (DUF202 family)